MANVVDIMKKTEEFLKSKGIPSPRREAEELMCHFLQWKRLDLYLKFDMPLREQEIQGLREAVQRRGNREPLSYITGTQGFYEHDFFVDKDVLCPRPDTETLVEQVLQKIQMDEDCFVADIGCGTGCIGLSIASARPNVKLYAVDISPAALSCTRKNIAHLELEKRVGLLQGNLLEAIPSNRSIDYLVSNPPYIPTADIDELEPEVRDFEPRLALDGGTDGLDIYKKILLQAQKRVQKGIFLEVGIHQAHQVASLVEDIIKKCPTSPLQNGIIEIHKDIGKIPRVVQISLS
jgi:release factor glutamine methyltransferase